MLRELAHTNTHTQMHQLDKCKQINLPIIKSNEDVSLNGWIEINYRFIVVCSGNGAHVFWFLLMRVTQSSSSYWLAISSFHRSKSMTCTFSFLLCVPCTLYGAWPSLRCSQQSVRRFHAPITHNSLYAFHQNERFFCSNLFFVVQCVAVVAVGNGEKWQCRKVSGRLSERKEEKKNTHVCRPIVPKKLVAIDAVIAEKESERNKEDIVAGVVSVLCCRRSIINNRDFSNCYFICSFHIVSTLASGDAFKSFKKSDFCGNHTNGWTDGWMDDARQISFNLAFNMNCINVNFQWIHDRTENERERMRERGARKRRRDK